MNRPNTVKVWDPLVRLLHWTLVVAFTVAFISGDEVAGLHEWAGYVVLGVVGVRLVWGLLGSRHARFADFVFRPAVVLHYARSVLKGSAKRYLGHNPLGGAMIVALLISLLATGASGLALDSTEPDSAAVATQSAQAPPASPLSSVGHDDGEREHEDHEGEGVWEEIHEFFANLTLLLVFLHIGGVMLSSFMHHENLVRAMFTGRKPLKAD
jgi:cytochrome b